ncbi:MAG: redoxin family protein [Chthoniobacterales bacterium]
MKISAIAIAAMLLMSAPARARAAGVPDIDWKGHAATVIFFILHDCPICNSYVPEMNRIVREYGGRGFGFVAAYLDVDFPPAEAQYHACEYRFDFPFVVDGKRELAARSGTTTVPEAAVFDRNGGILYRGRIDDLYAGIGQRRSAPTQRNLREALDAIAAGEKPKRALLPGVGCPIEPIK